MRKLVLLMILLAFVMAMPVSVPANGSGAQNASKYCKDNNDLGLTHGQCVSIQRACSETGNTGPVCFCKTLLNFSGAEFYEAYDNLGACISFMRTGINDG